MKKIKKNKDNIIILLFLISISCFTCAMLVQPNDYWWHIKAGEYIVNNKTIPFTDVFSWYGIQEKLYWHSHEWLTEVLFYLISPIKDSWFVFTVVSYTGLVVLLYLLNKKSYIQNKIFLFTWFILGAILFSMFLSPRPHMISFILLALTMYSLYHFRENENSKCIWSLPVISILWANFHGGSSNLPYVLCFIMLVTGLFEFKVGKIKGVKLSKNQIKKCLIVIPLCIFVLLINPCGFDIITYPYVNMQDTLMLSIINEWRSPDLKLNSDIIIYLIMAIPTLLFMVSKRNIDFTDFCFIGAFTYLSCKSVRFSALLFIVATFILIKYVENAKHNIKLKQYFKFTDDDHLLISNAFLNLMNVCTVFCLLVVFYGHNKLTINESFFQPVISDEVIQTIKKENPKRLYNNYDYGGYLIYNDIKVFVDGRADMYSGYNFEDVFIIDYYATPDTIAKYDFDMFLVAKGSAIYNYLQLHSDYKELISDEKCSLIKKVK